MFGRSHSYTRKASFAFTAAIASTIATFGPAVGGGWSAHAAGYGFDAGQEPAYYAANLAEANLTGANGGWLRVRGLAGTGGEGDHPARTITADRDGIAALHARGIRVCVILRWHPQEWSRGVRPGGGHRLPSDLREPYERARKIGATYGDIVDAWEIENEPDISFVMDNPETYAAFFKAVSLGIKDGAAATAAATHHNATHSRQAQTGRSTTDSSHSSDDSHDHANADGSANANVNSTSLRSPWLANKRGINGSAVPPPACIAHPLTTPETARVVMAPLALPPGPYFESLWANGLASYTDAFNFHYYGYAEDFTGVYRQFENAVSKTPKPGITLKSSSRHSSASITGNGTKASGNLPVFITEYGFGLLDAEARNTSAGRINQWQWFSAVAGQIRTLRPAAPMAFVLNPYLEAGMNEFGLSMETPARVAPSYFAETSGSLARLDVTASSIPAPTGALAGAPASLSVASPKNIDPNVAKSLTFTPADFGTKSVKPWMNNIGKKIGPAYASPALAHLWEYSAQNRYEARDWHTEAAPPSPVVIDFLAGPDMVQVKAANGYSLQRASAHWSPTPLRVGHGNWVLYNFSKSPVSGTLEISESALVNPSPSNQITLAPGERREIPVEFTTLAEEWKRDPLRARFVTTSVSARHVAVPAAHFSTFLFPATYSMVATRITDLRSTVADAATFSAQQNRPKSTGEPRLIPDGRWLKTDGVRIIDDGQGHWRFEVAHYPDEPLRPAMVELPLPGDFQFNANTALYFEYRNATVSPSVENRPLPPVSQRSRAPHGFSLMDVYFRTANGNLYQTWPRLNTRPEWAIYNQHAANFTMAFFGRAELPWRFADNKPVALVFFLRPASLQSAFEVRGLSIIRQQEL